MWKIIINILVILNILQTMGGNSSKIEQNMSKNESQLNVSKQDILDKSSRLRENTLKS
jgi:hypothetical protein